MSKCPCVYIITNKKRGVLYIGVSSNINKRIEDHKNKVVHGFSEKYNLGVLVWFEYHPTMISAIKREKEMKVWKRKWKLRLIDKKNPEWADLSDSLDIMPTGSYYD